MSIRNGDIIRHAKFKDVAFYITAVFTFSTGIMVRGYWVNQGFVETYFVPTDVDSHLIAEDDLPLWLKCDEPTAKCIRNSTWTQLELK
jgi:hypothetical protein